MVSNFAPRHWDVLRMAHPALDAQALAVVLAAFVSRVGPKSNATY